MWVTKVNYEARSKKEEYQRIVDRLENQYSYIETYRSAPIVSDIYNAGKVYIYEPLSGEHYNLYNEKVDEWKNDYKTIMSKINSFQSDLKNCISRASSKVDYYSKMEYYEVWEEDKQDGKNKNR